MFEDRAFYFKLGLRSKVIASNECWYKYRQHPDSICAVADRTGTHSIAKLRFFEWALKHLASSKIQRPDLYEAVTREISASLPLRGLPAMLETVVMRMKRLKQLTASCVREAVSGLPALRSAWQLAQTIRAACLASTPRAHSGRKEDSGRTNPCCDLEGIRYRREAEMLENVRGTNRFGCVLEIGCADALFTAILADRCNSLFVTDSSEQTTARCRNSRRWEQRVSFKEMHLLNESLPNVSDLIVVIHFSEQIKKPLSLRMARQKIVSGLRLGGYLLISSRMYDDEFGQGIVGFISTHPQLTVVDVAIHPLPRSISRDILLRKDK